jgi:hypothetical protein
MNENEELPQDLINLLNDFMDFFKHLDIDYWLGGGLLQKIYEGSYKDIENSWRDGKHDIDLFCMKEKKDYIEASDFLIQRGYTKLGDFCHKTAYVKNNKSSEIMYFNVSDCDPKIIYYLSWGKKELWKQAINNLDDPKRQRMYRHDFPKEILDTKERNVHGINIRSLSELYIKLSYPKLLKD